MEVFDINGQIISPLAGKTLYVAGDSIAYGKGSAGGAAEHFCAEHFFLPVLSQTRRRIIILKLYLLMYRQQNN